MMMVLPHTTPAEYTFVVDYKYDDGSISSIKYVKKEKYDKFNVGEGDDGRISMDSMKTLEAHREETINEILRQI